MYATLFNFKNTSDTDQEIELFNTAEQSTSGTVVVYTYRGTLLGANPIWNRTTNLIYDQTIVAQPGEIGTTFRRKDGTKLDIRRTGLTDIPVADVARELTLMDPSAGTWTFELTDATTGAFQATLTTTPNWLSRNNIDTDSSLAVYGAETLNFRGLFWTAGNFTPTSNGNVLKTNPNVIVSSYSDFSYNDFLWSTTQRVYDVKNFQIWSPSQNQLLEPFLFDRKTAAGKEFQRVLTPTIDPYQDQNYVITPENKGYILDGFTNVKYKVLANTEVRMILDYTFIDISTPLVAKLVSPKLNKDLITPLFVSNMERGYSKFGCAFLIKRSTFLSEKLKKLLGQSISLDKKLINPNDTGDYSNQIGTSNSVIPCWGCIDGQIQQHGELGGDTGYTNSNMNGWCGQHNGNDMYDNPNHPNLQDCSGYGSSESSSSEGSSSNEGSYPKWQEKIKSKLLYIKQMLLMYDCMKKEEIEKLPQFEMVGTEYRRLNLWMPSSEFVQAQLDAEQGARKLFDKFDFPIVVKDW
jgi:hypothetical protein